MFWSRWRRGGRPAVATGRALYAAAAAQAREPTFYAGLGVPDTANARFELYSLHVILLLHRLKTQAEGGDEIGQALFDTYLSALDDALREQGVGDLSVGKSMRRLGEAFYGRVRSYDSALAAPAELEPLLAKTVYADAAVPPAALAAYALRAVALLQQQADTAVAEGRVDWPVILT